MHQNIKNAQYILENKMLTSIVTHYKSLELSILNIKSALHQYRPQSSNKYIGSYYKLFTVD